MSDRLTTGAIVKALQSRFCAPEWACFMEVQQSTGGYGGRSADCVAMNLFPSRGLRVHGVEVKASRGDFLRELKAPEKAEPIARFCDHWWIATVPGVVLPGELPPTWGLMELTGGVMRQKVAPPKLEAAPMDRGFIAAMFRRASDRATKELATAVEQRLERDRQQMQAEIDRGIAYRTSDYEALKRAVDDFEKASGITITSYRGADLGKAAKLAMDLKLVGWNTVQTLAEEARKWADLVDEKLGVRVDNDG